MSPNDYVIRIHTSWSEVDAAAWDALLATAPSPTPFLRHGFLAALETSGSATEATGWSNRPLTLWCGKELVGGCAVYEKTHSYGEYVFDWAWADAYERHALAYYPKLLAAVPFTPVPGSRLLARDCAARLALLHGLRQWAEEAGHSSVHLLFPDGAELDAARRAGWLVRSGVQFHWHNPPERPYVDFGDFLSRMQRDKRKKIQQERRRVQASGVQLDARWGDGIEPDDWDFFYRCYVATYRAHRSTPYLTRDFFRSMAECMPQHWLMFIATREGQRIAASLIALDPTQGVAYGRYWGALEAVDCLHFEACYYAPLAWCIAQGYKRFEGGAQGEHKLARGLTPVRTHSAHWLGHPAFRDAVARFLEREAAGVQAYVDELDARAPFKRTEPPTP